LRVAGPIILLCSLGYILVSSAQAFEEKTTCVVYFHGIGCPRCAKYDPIVFDQLMSEYPNLAIIEYEIYRQPQNAPLLYDYHAQYNSWWKIPLMIFEKDEYVTANLQATNQLVSILEKLSSNKCPLIDGSSQDFNDLDPQSLPGYPRIWYKGRILIRVGPEGDGELLRKLLTGDDTFWRVLSFKQLSRLRLHYPGKKLNSKMQF